MSRALLLMTSQDDKLPLETEPVASDNNTWLPNFRRALLNG